MWRWWVAITVGVTAVTLAIHIVLSWGLFATIFPGFALANDVQQIREERRIERETDLEAKIIEVKMKQCESEGVVRQLNTQTLQKMLVEYVKLTSRNYPVPGCDDFS
jgi:hypothetical protein